MNEYEAEKIINAYGSAVAKGDVRRLSWLPCSKAKIKQAYFIYIAKIIKDLGNLPRDMGQNLVQCYRMLNMFVDDKDADRLEFIKAKIDNEELDYSIEKNKKLFSEYLRYWTGGDEYKGGMMDRELHDEINEFIGECQKEVR